MRKGTPVTVQPPRGAAKQGKFVAEHATHNGLWYEIMPTDDTGKVPKGAASFRARPASVIFR